MSSISVIIPSFNSNETIQYTVNSLLKSSELPDEILVVNDGGMKIDLKNNDLISVIDIQHNSGLSYARNIGLHYAKSEYILYLDSDDFLSHNAIRELRIYINKYEKPDIIIYDGSELSEGNELREGCYKRNIYGYYQSSRQFLKELNTINIESFTPQVSMYLTKRELWSANRIYFPPIYHEDNAVLYSLINQSKSVLSIEKNYYIRRWVQNSFVTSGYNQEKVDHVLLLIMHLISEKIKYKIYYKSFNKYINKLIYKYYNLKKYNRKILMLKLLYIINNIR